MTYFLLLSKSGVSAILQNYCDNKTKLREWMERDTQLMKTEPSKKAAFQVKKSQYAICELKTKWEIGKTNCFFLPLFLFAINQLNHFLWLQTEKGKVIKDQLATSKSHAKFRNSRAIMEKTVSVLFWKLALKKSRNLAKQLQYIHLWNRDLRMQAQETHWPCH